jgi:Glutamate-1-semialdehyde aminotransferase
MPFRRFFGAKESPKQDTRDEPADASDAPDEVEENAEEAVAEEHDAADWQTRARAVLPTGASTGSKRSEALYGSADANGPTHYVQAIGCRVTDTEGNEYIDCTMALGSVALGYAEPNVTRAVVDVIAAGNVSGLSSALEVDVAERLCGIIPCADKVQFLKTGAEAMAAAVRLARTYTGRELVIAVGYFGWLDWCAEETAGVPEGTRRTIRRVAFDDVAALQAAVDEAGDALAAIVIEPVIERLPSVEWITKARELATAAGAVLIFDEMKTGFRLRTGGYQAYAEVMPDLAAFGKAMANGYPLAAVVGHRDIMDAARKTWISSTLASEASALAAAAAVLSWHDSADVCESLWTIGADMRRAIAPPSRRAASKA